MSKHRRLLFRLAVLAFGVTFLFLALAQRDREHAEHARLQAAFEARGVELTTAREQLAVSLLNIELEDIAFRDLTGAHQELQALHRESMDWGPLRAPRDCVREVILMDETAWPVNRDADLAYCLNAYEWCEGERTGLVEDLDQCFANAYHPSFERPKRDDPRAGDSDSSWIDWPEGHAVEPFPKHTGGSDGG